MSGSAKPLPAAVPAVAAPALGRAPRRARRYEGRAAVLLSRRRTHVALAAPPVREPGPETGIEPPMPTLPPLLDAEFDADDDLDILEYRMLGLGLREGDRY